PRPLPNRNDPVCFKALELFSRVIRPIHDNCIDVSLIAESKMHAEIIRAQVTRIRPNLAPWRLLTMPDDRSSRPDRKPVRLGRFQLEGKPMSLLCHLIA